MANVPDYSEWNKSFPVRQSFKVSMIIHDFVKPQRKCTIQEWLSKYSFPILHVLVNMFKKGSY